MGQMTFDFEADDNEPEEPQVKEKTEVKPKLEENKKEEKVIEAKVKEKKPNKKVKRKTKAHQLAKEQRDIPVSEFFEQNRHILGFDNPTHSLITAVKEGVDNSLDACEQAGILPDLKIEISTLAKD